MKVSSFALFFFFILCTSFQGFSYSFTDDFLKGLYWRELPLNVHISEDDENKKKFLTVVASEAVKVWEVGVNKKIWKLDQGDKGRNIIRWAKDFEKETGFDEHSTLAVTIRHSTGPYWANMEIILNPNKQFLKLDPTYLKFVLLHELGHSMGLGHSDDENSIMQASYNGSHSSFQDDLSGDDILGMEEVLTKMKNRQKKKLVSLNAQQKEKEALKGVSCGTVDLNNDGSGPFSFLLSLTLGVMVCLLTTRQKLFSFH